jgi:NADPH:quinone reductase-like Zn-dependent oxidoreductase
MALPRRMRAASTLHHGGLDAIEVHEVPVPEPGDDEVLVRVAAAGCNNTDIWTREGAYGGDTPAGWSGPVDFPRIQGGDVAGEVAAVGRGTSSVEVGTRVLVDPGLYDGDDDEALVVDVLGSERDGGFAEYVVVPASSVHSMEGSPLSDVELASLPIAYGTALGMLERGRAGEGHTVLVTGASGGVGLAAVQLAAARGCRVVAVSSGAKADAVRDAGAHHVVDRGEGALWARVHEVAGGGVDVAVDVVAGPELAEGIELLRPGGSWVVAGALAGHAVTLDVRRLYLANKALVGSTMHTPRVFRLLAELARRGEVRPVIAATYGLEQVSQAQRDLEKRAHVGKLVVVM